MIDKMEKKRLAILRILQDAGRALSSAQITDQLLATGYDVSERTVRLYLLDMEKEGLTEKQANKRCITKSGMDELKTARVIEKVGFLASKIDQMTYSMDFNLKNKEGSVVINISIMEHNKLEASIPLICKVFEEGYAMGRLITLFGPSEKIGEVVIPKGMLGIGTVCSITLNGVLLQHGIPANSRFGGLLELRNKKAFRFVEIINYDGTSIDPLEIFIRSGMTDYTGATETGNGRIGASFREMPANSRDRVNELAHRLEDVGLGGFMSIGWPGRPLLEIPVSEGRIGAIVIGGLNPVAILEEKGIKVHSRALAGLIDYKRLFPFEGLEKRFKDFSPVDN